MIMSETNLCRLCVKICSGYKRLYDANGQRNEVYEITVKYFHPMFLNVEEGSHHTGMCLECWHNISIFHNFQQSVVLAQAKLLEDEKQMAESGTLSNDNRTEDMEQEDFLSDFHLDDKFESAYSIPTPESSELQIQDIDRTTTTTLLEEESVTKSDTDSDDCVVEDDDDPIGYFTYGAENEETRTTLSETIEVDSQDNGSDDEVSERESELQIKPETEGQQSNLPAQLKYNSRETSISEGNSTTTAVDLPVEHKSKKRRRMDLRELDAFIQHYEPHLKCVICQEELPSYSLLKDHFHEQHPKEKCHVVCCERKLVSRYAVEEHIILHLDPDSFKCDLCHKFNPSKQSLDFHLHLRHSISSNNRQNSTTVDSNKKFKLRKTFKEIDDFIALWRPKLICSLCPKSYSTFTRLERHFSAKHSQAPHIVCCDTKLYKHHQVEDHLELHNNEMAYMCQDCNTFYQSRSALYIHRRQQHPILSDKRRIALDRREREVQSAFDKRIAQWKAELPCDLCSESRPSFIMLQEHFRLRHPQVECYVSCCRNKFYLRSSLVQHIRDCHNKCLTKRIRTNCHLLDEDISRWRSELECPLCQQLFPTYSLLWRHFRRDHPSEKCHIICCNSKLTLRSLVAKHIRIHHAGTESSPKTTMNGKAFGETNGGKATATTKSLKKTPTNGRPFKEMNAFIQHYEPLLKCSICQENWSSYALLQRHFHQYHPDEKCSIVCCQRKLMTRYKIEEHILVHLNPTIFKCQLCQMCYPTKVRLCKHLLDQHSILINDITAWTVPVTDNKKAKTTFKELDDFISQWYPQLHCVHCSTACSSFSLLEKHFQEIHPYNRCHIICCGLKLNRYDLEEHLLLHLNPNGFKCEICPSHFIKRSQLYAHMRTQHVLPSSWNVDLADNQYLTSAIQEVTEGRNN